MDEVTQQLTQWIHIQQCQYQKVTNPEVSMMSIKDKFSTWKTSQSKQARIEPGETNRFTKYEGTGDDNITIKGAIKSA